MKKLILIDDHKMLRKGISSFFTENSEWQIFAEAESLSQVENILPACSKSNDLLVAIVDIQLKESEGDSFSGFKAINKLNQADIPSVVFSSHDTGACIERAMSADVGAKGFVSKLSDEKMLLDAVNTVAEGKTLNVTVSDQECPNALSRTGVASIKNGRKFIGIELDKEYFNIANDRLESTKCD